MKVTIGTFNLNNLFSRYNFKGEIEAIKDEKTAVEAEYVYQFGSTDPKETRPTKESQFPPPGPAWTHRYKPIGGDMQYELYDQIWRSPSLAKRQSGAWIHRRKNLTGDGSDHDPSWVELSL
jgi:hypothetical protein